ncbi:cyclase family protein [Endozoicomonas sp. SM1973]|uniref:Cyclase family protein n=1 Tax=Spartinivicinus marinus TaxID=2994442 RepID=A0A853IH71_9GAMM|nr:cyclase family protein [Spartinivicinus marinus]MCX4029703.1 cyclase family protein [Spartinivicinus marinus]NYZ66916.1 cyclase family protein [Spartinivicinus marinus]
MKLSLTLSNKTYQVLYDQAVSIAIPLDFNGPQPNHFNVPLASSQTVETTGFIGDTRRGGSCNVEQLSLTPHCNGTHTECVGHILDKRISVANTIKECFIPAVVISLTPQKAGLCPDHYRPPLEATDSIIDLASVVDRLAHIPDEQLAALIIRTLPNPIEKQTWMYGHNDQPPFFSIDAMAYLLKRQVRHLLVDFPSVDKMYDEGKLTCHHRFWQIPEGKHESSSVSHVHHSISELVFVPDEVVDGFYLLNLQIPAFKSDAAPSRPVLIPLESV